MDWLLYFAFIFEIYCFLGWCLEEVYNYITVGHLKKDGFLKGPFKPMYGFAISSIIYFYYMKGLRGIPIGILFIVIPTLIEYLSGYVLKRYFGKVYWDYSKLRYNFQGLVCARFSMCWGVLVFITCTIIQPVIESIYFNFSGILNKTVPLIGIYIIIDIFLTVKQISYSKVNAV